MELCNHCHSLCSSLDRNDNNTGRAFRDWLKTQGHEHPVPDHFPQLTGLIHSSWNTFHDSLESKCPIFWTVWRHMRSSPLASYDEVRQGFALWVDNCQYQPSPEYAILEMKHACKPGESGSVVVSVKRTTKQRFEGIDPEDIGDDS
jgi:hypothetical protein